MQLSAFNLLPACNTICMSVWDLFIYFQAVWCREVGQILYAADSHSDGECVKPLRSEQIQKTSFGRVSPSGLCGKKRKTACFKWCITLTRTRHLSSSKNKRFSSSWYEETQTHLVHIPKICSSVDLAVLSDVWSELRIWRGTSTNTILTSYACKTWPQVSHLSPEACSIQTKRNVI